MKQIVHRCVKSAPPFLQGERSLCLKEFLIIQQPACKLAMLMKKHIFYTFKCTVWAWRYFLMGEFGRKIYSLISFGSSEQEIFHEWLHRFLQSHLFLNTFGPLLLLGSRLILVGGKYVPEVERNWQMWAGATVFQKIFLQDTAVQNTIKG